MAHVVTAILWILNPLPSFFFSGFHHGGMCLTDLEGTTNNQWHSRSTSRSLSKHSQSVQSDPNITSHQYRFLLRNFRSCHSRFDQSLSTHPFLLPFDLPIHYISCVVSSLLSRSLQPRWVADSNYCRGLQSRRNDTGGACTTRPRSSCRVQWCNMAVTHLRSHDTTCGFLLAILNM